MGTPRAFGPDEHAAVEEDLEFEALRAAAAADRLSSAARARPAARDTPPFAHLGVHTCFSMRDG